MLLALLAAASCAPLPGIDAALARPELRYLFFGEYHGTAEMPALVADAICHAKASGREVVLGVELPTTAQPALDRYTKTGRKADLIADPVWKAQDGRVSAAISDLIAAARRLRVRTLAFDSFWAGGVSTMREQAMADALVRAGKDAGLVVVLTGTGHADKEGFTSRTPPVASAAMRLRAAQTLSLTFARPGGRFWGCQAPNGGVSDGCRAYDMPAREPIRPCGIVIDPSYRGGFDGFYSTGAPYSASQPMRPD